MGSTVAHGDQPCPRRPKYQPTAPDILVTEALVESMLVLHTAHREITVVIEGKVRGWDAARSLRALRDRIERTYPEIQAGYEAAEERIGRRHGTRARGVS